MRMTLSVEPVNDDFPWAGSATMAAGYVRGGETEDYPVTIRPVTVEVAQSAAPKTLWLGSAMPNPARFRTSMHFGLSREGPARVTAYDLAGRKLHTLLDGPQTAGEHSVRWDYRDGAGRDLAAGVYIVKLEAEGKVLMQRVVRLP